MRLILRIRSANRNFLNEAGLILVIEDFRIPRHAKLESHCLGDRLMNRHKAKVIRKNRIDSHARIEDAIAILGPRGERLGLISRDRPVNHKETGPIRQLNRVEGHGVNQTMFTVMPIASTAITASNT